MWTGKAPFPAAEDSSPGLCVLLICRKSLWSQSLCCWFFKRCTYCCSVYVCIPSASDTDGSQDSTMVREGREPDSSSTRGSIWVLSSPLCWLCVAAVLTLASSLCMCGVCVSGGAWLNIFVRSGILVFEQMSLEYYLIRFPIFEMCQ